jgi:hypothetical protein
MKNEYRYLRQNKRQRHCDYHNGRRGAMRRLFDFIEFVVFHDHIFKLLRARGLYLTLFPLQRFYMALVAFNKSFQHGLDRVD